MDNSKRYGVIVGINEYNISPLENLRYCQNDAHAIYSSAINLMNFDNEDLLLFTDEETDISQKATYSNILSAIREMCDKATEDDLILFFFAGHGTADENDSYLLTNEFRPNILKDSSISISKINDFFQQSKAKFKLRIIDACHSGRLGVRGNDFLKPNIDEHFNVSAEGWATFSACKVEQYAHEIEDIGHGLFTYYFIKALSNAHKGNECISLDALKIEVLDNVIAYSKKIGAEQTPVYCGEQIGNLILIPVIDQDISSDEIIAISNFNLSEYLPKFENIGSDIEMLNSLINETRKIDDFVHSNQDEKINFIQNCISFSKECFEVNLEKFGNDNYEMNIEEIALENIPLNRIIAKKIHNRSFSELIEAKYVFDTVSKTKKENQTITEKNNSPFSRFTMSETVRTWHETVDVTYEEEILTGIKQNSDYPNLALQINFIPKKKTLPICSLCFILLPISFGAYRFSYFCSTSLTKSMKEIWNEDSIILNDLIPVSISKGNDGFVDNINSYISDFISFIKENILIREKEILSLGIDSERIEIN